jgi:ATP-dependent DNA helicase PIF1
MGERGKNVQITCSTGIACTVYSRKFKVCTVHKFLGLGDGRYGPAEISQIIKNSPKYDYVLHNLRDLDCLIVDECSMVSARTFEIINAVCQLKNEKLKFGGIQVIFCGDFYQLPPVANTLYQDTGKYCFESEIFTDIFVHRVVLSNNTRTDDERLVRTIH